MNKLLLGIVLVGGGLISSAIAAQNVIFHLDDVQEVVSDFNQVLTQRKGRWGKSTIITNKLPNPYDRVQIIEGEERQIFDLSILVYDKDFAIAIGQPEGFVIDMPEGLGMLSYVKVTHGLRNRCFLKMAIDKRFKINSLGNEYASYKEQDKDLYGTRSINRENILTPYSYDHRLNFGPIYMVSVNRKEGKESYKERKGGYITYYTNERYRNYHYLSWNIGCSSTKSNYVGRDWQLWVAKEGVRYDYTIASDLNAEDFWHFSMPKDFLVLMQSVSDIGDKNNYLSPVNHPEKFTNKENN